MLKKKLKIGIMLFSLLIAGGTVTTAKAYNRDDAQQYAERWAESYNTNKYYIANLDCTNFVSQCLEAGGKRRSSSLPSYEDTSRRRPHSATWENADYFRRYWKNHASHVYGRNLSGLTYSNKMDVADNIKRTIQKGDVIQYGTGATNMCHSQIAHGYSTFNGRATLLMAQHTSGQKGIYMHQYILSTTYSYVKYYDMTD